MIQQGKDRHKAVLKTMWKHCFPSDTEQFISFYFDEIYKNEETLLYLIDDQPIASLQIIPYTIRIGNTIHSAGYISGTMTHPDYRKRGYMRELLTVSFDEMEKKGYDYTFLIPEKEELIDMYAKFGFRLCEPNPEPPKNKVLKTLKQWAYLRQEFYDRQHFWLEGELISVLGQEAMVKRLNPAVEEITTLYMGMMLA